MQKDITFTIKCVGCDKITHSNCYDITEKTLPKLRFFCIDCKNYLFCYSNYR